MMKPHKKFIFDYLATIKYLNGSETRLKRLRGRRRIISVLDAEKKRSLLEFPVIDSEGAPIVSAQRGYACPVCRVPCRNSAILCSHMMNKHGCQSKCFCGKNHRSKREFVRHIASVKDLGSHFVLSSIMKIGMP